MGVASFVLALLAWPFTYVYWIIGAVSGILAIVFGAVSFKNAGYQRGLGIAGFVIGVIYVVLFIIGIIGGIAILTSEAYYW